MLTPDILAIANQAGLKISVNDSTVDIRHKYRVGDRSNWGVLLLLPGGIFLMLASFLKTSGNVSKIAGIAIGLLFFIMSVLTLIRQVADRLTIKNQQISFRYNLRAASVLPGPGMKIKMETEISEISRVGSLGSTFISARFYLQTINKEIPVFKFQMNNTDAAKAIRLGKEITRIINERLQQLA